MTGHYPVVLLFLEGTNLFAQLEFSRNTCCPRILSLSSLFVALPASDLDIHRDTAMDNKNAPTVQGTITGKRVCQPKPYMLLLLQVATFSAIALVALIIMT